MGLDSVEMVMALEEEFQIQIPSHCAAQMVAVGQVVDHVHAAVNGVDEERERVEWAKIDALFVRMIGREVSSLPLATKVVDLLDEERMLEQWDVLDLVPAAERPAWLRWSVAVISALLGLVTFLLLRSELIWGILVGIGGAIGAAVLLGGLTHRFREVPAGECELTLGEMVWWRGAVAAAEVPRAQIFEKVADIVAEQLGVERTIVEEDRRFVEDLGMA